MNKRLKRKLVYTALAGIMAVIMVAGGVTYAWFTAKATGTSGDFSTAIVELTWDDEYDDKGEIKAWKSGASAEQSEFANHLLGFNWTMGTDLMNDYGDPNDLSSDPGSFPSEIIGYKSSYKESYNFLTAWEDNKSVIQTSYSTPPTPPHPYYTALSTFNSTLSEAREIWNKNFIKLDADQVGDWHDNLELSTAADKIVPGNVVVGRSLLINKSNVPVYLRIKIDVDEKTLLASSFCIKLEQGSYDETNPVPENRWTTSSLGVITPAYYDVNEGFYYFRAPLEPADDTAYCLTIESYIFGRLNQAADGLLTQNSDYHLGKPVAQAVQAQNNAVLIDQNLWGGVVEAIADGSGTTYKKFDLVFDGEVYP